MPVSFVYFDLDDTLLDHRAFAPHLGAHDLAMVQETYHAANVPLWHDYAAGRISKDDLKRLRIERLLSALAVTDLAPEVLGRHYLRCYARHWRWVAGAEAAFHTVADRLPVGVLTNGFAEIQRAKLDRFPALRERTAAVVISEEVGAMKPDPAIFCHAAEAAGVAPGAILYVGDALRSDVEGGRGAGWQVAWWQGDAARADVFAFNDWRALLARLGA